MFIHTNKNLSVSCYHKYRKKKTQPCFGPKHQVWEAPNELCTQNPLHQHFLFDHPENFACKERQQQGVGKEVNKNKMQHNTQ